MLRECVLQGRVLVVTCHDFHLTRLSNLRETLLLWREGWGSSTIRVRVRVEEGWVMEG